jgi:hypothetical protein
MKMLRLASRRDSKQWGKQSIEHPVSSAVRFAFGEAIFSRFFHFAPVLSCESKNGGFGRNDRVQIAALAMMEWRLARCLIGM